MGVKESVPFAVGVGRSDGCEASHSGLSGLGSCGRRRTRSACRVRGRLKRTRHPRGAEQRGRDWWATLAG